MSDEDDIFFLEEDEEETKKSATTELPAAWKVMVVDDDNEIHSVTKLVLAGFKFQGRPLKIIDVYSGKDAIKAIQENPDTALMLLDIVMESEHAGLKVVKAVRSEIKNDLVRIVLRTGQPGQAPEKDIIEQYDINDYKDKTELTSQKLITLLYSALRSYSDILEVNRKKQEAEIYYTETVTKLEASKKHIFNIIDSMPSILICVKQDFTVTDWNKQASELTKIPMEEAVGKNVMDVFSQAKHMKQLLDATFEHKKEQIADRVMLAIDKQQHHYYVAIYPITLGDSIGAVIRMDDISSQIMKDNMMMKSEKMAAVGGLATGIAHEVRNPLGLIIQNTQNLINRIEKDNPKNKEFATSIGLDFDKMIQYLQDRKVTKFAQNMREAADSALELINNLISFGVNDDTEMKYIPAKQIISDAVSLLRKDGEISKVYSIDQNPIEINTEDNLPDLPCMQTQLVQALLNLLKLAIDDVTGFTDYPRITISAYSADNDAIIAIKDNGKGYEKEVAANLFSLEHSPLDSRRAFGLSVCHYIVTEQHHGKIEIETAPKEGLHIRITLPKMLRASQLRAH